MGGVGSGTWYRFGKKTTIEECRSLDVKGVGEGTRKGAALV
jgi:hypothetical protein